jgi:hypothetical protein
MAAELNIKNAEGAAKHIGKIAREPPQKNSPMMSATPVWGWLYKLEAVAAAQGANEVLYQLTRKSKYNKAVIRYHKASMNLRAKINNMHAKALRK